MATLFDRNWNRNQLERYTGAAWQVGGVRHMRFVEGVEDGTDVVQFDTGTGLIFNVLPHRGLDIASAKFCGASLSYDTPAGEAHPTHFDPHGIGWLKTFFSGLLTTCGLTWAGAACEDQGVSLGIHGRYSHTPCRYLKIGDEWIGNTRRLWVSGEIRESVIFGPNIVLRRTISTELGSNTITIEDHVRNEAFEKIPHQLIYHINIGFPVLDENTELLIDSKWWPRDDEAEKGKEEYNRFETPKAGYAEKAYYHDIKPDRKGFCHLALVNRRFENGKGIGVHVRHRKKELHRFCQWKMMGAGTYVCGLEPANCSVQGRAHDRQDGTLVFLKPGEERYYFVEISVLPDNDAINAIM